MPFKKCSGCLGSGMKRSQINFQLPWGIIGNDPWDASNEFAKPRDQIYRFIQQCNECQGFGFRYSHFSSDQSPDYTQDPNDFYMTRCICSEKQPKADEPSEAKPSETNPEVEEPARKLYCSLCGNLGRMPRPTLNYQLRQLRVFGVVAASVVLVVGLGCWYFKL
jgi:hypothetical protein